MKKSFLIPAVTVTLLMGMEAAKAEEIVVPISDMQLEESVAIDVAGNEGMPQDVSSTDNIPGGEVKPDVSEPVKEPTPTPPPVVNTPTQTPAETPPASAPDKQEKPYQITDGSTEESSELKVDITKPENDTVVLTEGGATVEKLADTGVVNKGLLYALTAALMAVASLLKVRKKKEKEVQ